MPNGANTDKHGVPNDMEKSTDEPVRRGGSRSGPDLTGCTVEIRRVYPDKNQNP